MQYLLNSSLYETEFDDVTLSSEFEIKYTYKICNSLLASVV